jgi:hypothetical protein
MTEYMFLHKLRRDTVTQNSAIDVHIPTMLQFYCTVKLYEKEKNKLTSTTLLKADLGQMGVCVWSNGVTYF